MKKRCAKYCQTYHAYDQLRLLQHVINLNLTISCIGNQFLSDRTDRIDTEPIGQACA